MTHETGRRRKLFPLTAIIVTLRCRNEIGAGAIMQGCQFRRQNAIMENKIIVNARAVIMLHFRKERVMPRLANKKKGFDLITFLEEPGTKIKITLFLILPVWDFSPCFHCNGGRTAGEIDYDEMRHIIFLSCLIQGNGKESDHN